MNRLASAAVFASLLFASTAAPAAEPPDEAVANFALRDHRGDEVSLDDYRDSKLVVLAFLGTECPLAKLYAARLEEIAKACGRDQLAVIALDSNVQDDLTEIGAFARRQGLSYPLLKDLGNKVADDLDATRTPTVLLLDDRRVIRYRGRIDDQYLVGIQRSAPQREDLKQAIDELLAGRPVSILRTEPLGCLIGRVRESTATGEVTWSNQIARIFGARCVHCHRAGEIGPFPLTSYEDAAGWGEMIAEVVRDRRMPPWHADRNHGRFANDGSLSDDEKTLIFRWVADGCPQGDPNDAPPLPTFADGWQLPREPDRVVAMAEKPFVVPAEAGPEGIAYQNFWVDPGFTEETWVRAIEVRPGSHATVHHVVIYLHPAGKEENFNGFESGKQFYFLAAYVPGQLPAGPFPNGAAKRIPAGSWFRFEVHYVPVGTPQEDMSRVGMIFADREDVTHEVRTLAVVQSEFKIRPFEPNEIFTRDSAEAPIDMQILGFFPHMHLRGKSFRYEALDPAGRAETLLSVPRYDFNWQTRYALAEPKPLPAGSRLRITAAYDNSPANLANPDPSATVANGEQTWDEMMIGYFDVLYPVDDAPEFPFGFF